MNKQATETLTWKVLKQEYNYVRSLFDDSENIFYLPNYDAAILRDCFEDVSQNELTNSIFTNNWTEFNILAKKIYPVIYCENNQRFYYLERILNDNVDGEKKVHYSLSIKWHYFTRVLNWTNLTSRTLFYKRCHVHEYVNDYNVNSIERYLNNSVFNYLMNTHEQNYFSAPHLISYSYLKDITANGLSKFKFFPTYQFNYFVSSIIDGNGEVPCACLINNAFASDFSDFIPSDINLGCYTLPLFYTYYWNKGTKINPLLEYTSLDKFKQFENVSINYYNLLANVTNNKLSIQIMQGWLGKGGIYAVRTLRGGFFYCSSYLDTSVDFNAIVNNPEVEQNNKSILLKQPTSVSELCTGLFCNLLLNVNNKFIPLTYAYTFISEWTEHRIILSNDGIYLKDYVGLIDLSQYDERLYYKNIYGVYRGNSITAQSKNYFETGKTMLDAGLMNATVGSVGNFFTSLLGFFINPLLGAVGGVGSLISGTTKVAQAQITNNATMQSWNQSGVKVNSTISELENLNTEYIPFYTLTDYDCFDIHTPSSNFNYYIGNTQEIMIESGTNIDSGAVPGVKLQIYGDKWVSLLQRQQDIFYNGYEINGFVNPTHIPQYDYFNYFAIEDDDFELLLKSDQEYYDLPQNILNELINFMRKGFRMWKDYNTPFSNVVKLTANLPERKIDLTNYVQNLSQEMYITEQICDAYLGDDALNFIKDEIRAEINVRYFNETNRHIDWNDAHLVLLEKSVWKPAGWEQNINKAGPIYNEQFQYYDSAEIYFSINGASYTSYVDGNWAGKIVISQHVGTVNPTMATGVYIDITVDASKQSTFNDIFPQFWEGLRNGVDKNIIDSIDLYYDSWKITYKGKTYTKDSPIEYINDSGIGYEIVIYSSKLYYGILQSSDIILNIHN